MMMVLLSKKLKIVGGIGFSILLVVGAYVFISSKVNLKFLPSDFQVAIDNIKQSSNSVDKNIPNVLYPGKPDLSGRDVFYLSSELGDKYNFSSIGVNYFPTNTNYVDSNGELLFKIDSDSAITNYILGSFVKWEDISNSRDRYLILEDPLKTRISGGELVTYPKIRIGFGTSEDVGKKGYYFTAIGVEDLTYVVPTVKNKNMGVKHYKFGLIGDLLPQDLNTLIREKDVLTIITTPLFSEKRDLKDPQGQVVAGILFIRRYNPIETLPKELNRLINFHE
jgi:hypothetical protein